MRCATLLSAMAAVGLTGCAAVAPPSALPEPDVVMAADPPPPFTYWAPAGSTIRNHAREPGTWIAEIDGRPAAFYFGDECRASEYQAYVGHPLEALPQKPARAVWRASCSTCAVTSDLSRSRMNISYDEQTRRIEAIACG